MSKTIKSRKEVVRNILESFNLVNKKHQDENQKISEVKKQHKEEDETKGNQAKDDKLKGKEKEKKLEGQSSSQEPSPTTPPEKEPKGDEEEEEEEKNKEAETTEEDKGIKIFPKDFDITWGDDSRYWIRPTDETSEKPAELKQVCWLQVTGSKRVKTGKSYEIEFNITLKADAFGWNGLPLFLMAKIGAKGKSIWKKIKPLEETGREEKFDIPKPEEKFTIKIPKPEDDKGDEEKDLFFGLYEIWSNKWKGGLLINYATVKEVSSPN